MPYGSGPLARQALLRANPWQRCLIGLAMVARGVVLVVLGHVAGALFAITGLLLVARMVRHQWRRRHGEAATAGVESP